MYTRCDECQTLFRVTRAQLNAARGQVRCGRCGNVFDALAALEEELLSETPTTPSNDEVESPIDAQTESFDTDVEAVSDMPARAPMFLPFDVPVHRRRRWPWVLATLVLLIALAAQLVHLQRATLIENEAIAPYLSMTYEALGRPVDVTERYDLDAFALLHHELVSHPQRAGALHLSGVLNNTAPFAQAWPVIELRLEDRFGDVVAARRLDAHEYLRNPPATNELMAAGARRAIEIEFVDPGVDAVGFSIEFCQSVRDGVRCGAQPAR